MVRVVDAWKIAHTRLVIPEEWREIPIIDYFFLVKLLHNFNLALKKQQSCGFIMKTDQTLILRKLEIMLTTKMIRMENAWNNFQEPRCSTNLPNSCMVFLSALDQGWKVIKVELVPSWDQHGFIYLVTLKRQSHQSAQQLILPQNPLVSNLLQEYGPKVISIPSGEYQPA